MKKTAKVFLSVLLTLALALTVVTALPFTAAAADSSFTLKLESNFFPAAERVYPDLSKYADENGDVYITAEFKLYAADKYLLNVDIDQLTWDPAVLEWKESYNMNEYFPALLNLFPFAVDAGKGAGTYNTFGDENGGRVVGNYANLDAPDAFYADGMPVTVVKAVFKVLDKTAAETTVTCNLDSMSLCDKTAATAGGKAYVQYKPIENGVIHTDDASLTETSVEVSPKTLFTGHKLSLSGDIGVKFRLDLTDDQFDNGNPTVSFRWFDKELNDVPLHEEADGFWVTCPVAVAEMTYPITATATINGVVQQETDTFSVRDYADIILSNPESPEELQTLVKTMLDYGAKAQLRFDRKTDDLANGGTDFYTDADDPFTVATTPSDMTAGLEQYGLTHNGTSVIFLTETTLRHYYKITDPELFNSVKDSVKINGKAAAYGEANNEIYYDIPNIAAKNLDVQQVLTIGNTDYKYSVMDYANRLIEKSSNNKAKELARAAYRYNQAAKAYFSH